MPSTQSLLAAQLVGAWALLHWEIRTPDGRSRLPFGADAGGLLLYSADGWMSAALYRARRTPLAAETPAAASAEARGAVLDEYLAYGGRWSLHGNTVTHDVLHAANPALIGTRQLRHARLVGDRLFLTAEESTPTPRTHSIEWRKADAPAL
jgi:hypothetical protein